MFFSALLLKSGWVENVDVVLDSNGTIQKIEEAEPSGGNIALPGFRNAHSHAFQYAMAGVAENHTNPGDDFWSWRSAMYRLALEVDPDDVESIASMLYAELRRHGSSHVTEFHYLHNDKNGSRYADPAEMGNRLLASAQRTGLAITLVPMFYRLGNFGENARDEQKRFISNNPESYFSLVESFREACLGYQDANLGIGVHSMRAASAEDIRAICKAFPDGYPFHIHIAEQLKEVDDCVEFYGERPVEWLLGNVEVNARYNLIHATHITEEELTAISNAGASVVLCPTTEGNLGDGIFPLREYRSRGGTWSVGTDSHVSLDPFEELRLLDYGQRLVSHSRNTFGETGSHYAIQQMHDGGAVAAGLNESDFFEVGAPFNACVITKDHPLVGTSGTKNLLNAIVYASDASCREGSIVRGKPYEPDEKIVTKFEKTIRKLQIRL